MDEFHYYADRDRGVAWQVPLLTMPQTRFLLMSATLGDTTLFRGGTHRLNGRPTVTVKSGDAAGAAGVRLCRDPAAAHDREAGRRGQDARSTSSTSRRRTRPSSAQDFTSLKICTREEKARDRGADRGLRLQQPLRRRHPQVAAARHRPAPRGAAAEVSRPGRAAGAAGAAEGDLRHGHARRGHQRADPHGALHAALQVRRPEDRAS